MSNTLLNSVSQLFRPQQPLWACEFTPRHLIVIGTEPSRRKIMGKLAIELAPGAVAGSLSDRNLVDRKSAFEHTKDALARAGYKGSEISVVIPDDATRIVCMTAESLPASREERETFLRWKLKKSVPFDADTSEIAFRILGPHEGNGLKGVDLLVALSPRAVVHEYENLFESLELHAGFVVPSTLAALNMYTAPKADALFVKIAPGCITTTVFQNERARFYRRITEAAVYDAVYPTILYYQDKLGGVALGSITVCGYDTDVSEEISELRRRLDVPVYVLDPKNIEDIYKPALGAVDFAWADLI